MEKEPEQNPTGSASEFAAELKKVLGTNLPTPEEFKEQKAETEFKIMKNRAEARERHLEKLKQTALKIIRGETDDE